MISVPSSEISALPRSTSKANVQRIWFNHAITRSLSRITHIPPISNSCLYMAVDNSSDQLLTDQERWPAAFKFPALFCRLRGLLFKLPAMNPPAPLRIAWKYRVTVHHYMPPSPHANVSVIWYTCVHSNPIGGECHIPDGVTWRVQRCCTLPDTPPPSLLLQPKICPFRYQEH